MGWLQLFGLLTASPARLSTSNRTQTKRKRIQLPLHIVSYQKTVCSWVVVKEIMLSVLHIPWHDRQAKRHAHREIASAGEILESLLKSIPIKESIGPNVVFWFFFLL